MQQSCPWASSSSQMQAYHDHEWGFVTHDNRELFELLSLEIMQAGLSWQTVLNKRANFKAAFANFDYHVVAKFTVADEDRLRQDAGIIRNRLKIQAIIKNAQVLVAWEANGKTLDEFVWHFTAGKQVIGGYHTASEVPSQSPLSQQVSKEMKRLGFHFTGPTTIYSWLQACGVLNDHLVTCPAFSQAQKLLN